MNTATTARVTPNPLRAEIEIAPIDPKVTAYHARMPAYSPTMLFDVPELAARLGKVRGVGADIVNHCIDDVLVQSADALSAARPGARREMLESYVKRLQDLERIATSFDGVGKSFAIQAGRELRIMVMSDKVDDDTTALLSKDIAKKVEEELSDPGQIKITVIRETRAVEYAK